MGHNRNERLEGLLVQKDQEIATLETQVQAYIARISILQTRLLSALDTLDVIQLGRKKELDAMAQDNKRLKDKLQRYSTIVKTAELERDDMRDAVLKLVEKVELSNDYSMWPHSQIHLSSLTGSSGCQSLKAQAQAQASESDLLIHATTMIEVLRRERDFERRAHAQTRDMAQARINSLEAQLSRREAELEFLISGAAHTVSTIQHKDADQLTDEQLPSEQVISALDDATVARNKMLEIEIRGLYKRLENIRVSASSCNLDAPPPPPLGGLQQRREIQGPSKPISSIMTTHRSPSVLGVLGGPTVYERSRPTDADPALPLSDSLDHQAINDLRHHIKTLDAQIDAFAETRRSIAQTLRTDIHQEDLSYPVETRLESRKGENHQLRLSKRSQVDTLDPACIGAQARENRLLDEIQSPQSSPQPVLEEPNDVYSLLEPESEYGEMSIELATPLLPIRMMLEANSPHASPLTPYLDPPSIPLPPSPDDHPTSNSPALSQLILSDRNTHRERSDSSVSEVENVEKALHPP